MQLCENTVVVHPGIYVSVVSVQFDDFVLPGLHGDERDIHAVFDADHDVFASGTGACDDGSLDALEFSVDDPHAVSFCESFGSGCQDGDFVAVGAEHPFQVFHLLVRDIGIVLFAVVSDFRQEVVLGDVLFQCEDFGFGGVDKYVIVQERSVCSDDRSVFPGDFDIGRCEEFECFLSVPGSAVHFGDELSGGVSAIESLLGYGQRQDIPPDAVPVPFRANQSGDGIFRINAVFRYAQIL